MKTKELLYEWKSFLQKDMINEISIKRFQEQYPDFDTSRFTPQLKGNTDYLDIIKNSIDAGQSHGSDDYIQQFDFYKNSIEPNRNNQEFLVIDVPGDDPVSLLDMVNRGSCTATYDDIQQFQQARMFTLGKGSKSKLIAAYEKVVNDAAPDDFEFVTEDSDWIIYYPKSQRGSIALARSYWDGNKIVYDKTFNPSKGLGQNSGLMNWCTSVSGGGNMFITYHRQLNAHMYYCIKKTLSNTKDVDRKLCVSFFKEGGVVSFKGEHLSVNANNSKISEDDAKQYLGQLYNILTEDAKQEKRLEIDMESYYRSISISQYIILREANEENIGDFLSELYNIVKYSKDSEKIVDHCVRDKNPEIRKYIAKSSEHLTLQHIETLTNDVEAEVRASVASIIFAYSRDEENVPEELILKLASDQSEEVRLKIAGSAYPPAKILKMLANDESVEVVRCVALGYHTPRETLLKIVNNHLENEKIIKSVVNNNNFTDEDFHSLFNRNDLTVSVKATLVFKGSQNIYKPESGWGKMLSQEEMLDVYNEVKRSGLINFDILRNFHGTEIEEIYFDIVDFCEKNSKGNKSEVQNALLNILMNNKGVTERVITKIYNMTKDKSIIKAIARYHNTPASILRELLSLSREKKNGASMRRDIAYSYNIPSDMLEELSYDDAPSVRYQVAYHPLVPIDILERLSNDSSKKVSRLATNILAKKIKSESSLRNYIRLVLS